MKKSATVQVTISGIPIPVYRRIKELAEKEDRSISSFLRQLFEKSVPRKGTHGTARPDGPAVDGNCYT